MDKDIIDSYIKAGAIAKQAREYGISLCGEGVSYLEIANEVEKKIRSLGGELAFPTAVSVNEIAAHDCPTPEDKRILEKGDLVKVDLGVAINGYIADTSASVSIGKDTENDELIKASEQALERAIDTVKYGVELASIGRAIENSVGASRIKVIRNLSGHSLGKYEVHAGLSIPNYDSGDGREVKDIAIAIEPFTTYGAGLIVEGKPAGIYSIQMKKPVRVGKEVLTYFYNKYKTLPFSKREAFAKFGRLKASVALKYLINQGVLHEYSVLREKAGRKVAQTEHTLLVLKDKVIVTTR